MSPTPVFSNSFPVSHLFGARVFAAPHLTVADELELQGALL
jgi:hypothetical protein